MLFLKLLIGFRTKNIPVKTVSSVNNMLNLQLRREVRQRREYLYRKAQEDRLRTIEDKKQNVKKALDGRIINFHFSPAVFTR